MEIRGRDRKMVMDDALNAFSPVSTPRFDWKSRRRSGTSLFLTSTMIFLCINFNILGDFCMEFAKFTSLLVIFLANILSVN